MPRSLSPLIRVLIVDDEADFASALATRLQKRGFAADAVFGGHAAVERIAQQPYDVVVLDLKMPDQDGLSTWQEIRRLDLHVQAIVLTGHGTAAAGIGGMALGAADFLQKPVDIELLCDVIRAAAALAGDSRTGVAHHGDRGR
jgi:DNA-binding response OmpR family regulator